MGFDAPIPRRVIQQRVPGISASIIQRSGYKNPKARPCFRLMLNFTKALAQEIVPNAVDCQVGNGADLWKLKLTFGFMGTFKFMRETKQHKRFYVALPCFTFLPQERVIFATPCEYEWTIPGKTMIVTLPKDQWQNLR